ncbi:hypothetical protein B5S30_g4815 [[Candida] boidinii]|nr:hypothetical protein B5S30_g4815 [[Candida] boidinii]
MNTHKPLDKKRVDFKPRLLSCRFNQNQSCFAIGLETGFKVYNTDPMNVRTTKIFANASAASDSSVPDDSTDGNKSIYTGSGIGLVTMLNRTNYLALVGGGCNPKYPRNKVIIWDDLKKKESITLEFTANVLNVLISRLRIIVVLRNHVLIYSFESKPKLITKYETYDNDLGCAYLSSGSIVSSSSSSSSATQSLSSSGSSTAGGAPSSSSSGSDHHILAFPGRTVGQIQIIDMSPSKIDKNVVSIVKSHKNKITNICVSHGGHMIASASEIGTLIRVHSSVSGSLLFEFRRGADRANITSMEFSPNDSKLAVISDKNTLHVFNISDTINGNSMKDNMNNDNAGKRRGSGGSGGGDSDESNQLKEFRNKSHFLKNWNIFPSYYNSTWSFVSKHISDEADSELVGKSRSGKNGDNTGSTVTSSGNNTSDYTRTSSVLSPNVSGSSGIDNKTTKNEDTGILGWSDEYSIIVIWKLKCKWEKYVIVEKEYTPRGGSHNKNSLDNDDHGEGQQHGKSRKWELVREGWRSFGNLNN